MTNTEQALSRAHRVPRGLGTVASVDGAVVGLAAATGSMGIATSVVVTTASLFLADAVHAAPLLIGLFFAGRGVAEIATDLVVGVASDRLRSRRALLAVCCLLSALGALSYLVLRNYYALFLAGVLFFGTGGASFAQVFAYTREFAQSRGYRVTSFNSVLRAVNAAAWVIGPPAGFYLLAGHGFPSVYGLVAVLFLIGAALCRWALPKLAGAAGAGPRQRAGQPFAGLSLRTYLLLGAVALLLAVNSAYQIVIALHVTKDLGMSTVVVGWLVGLCAAVEIPAAILIGAKADRVGKLRMTAIAAGGAALFYCALPFASSVQALLLLQLPNAAWTAVVMSIPVLILQEDVPDRLGVASSLYAMAFKVGVLLGGSVTGVTAAAVGYASVFWVCAGLAAAAALLLLARSLIAPPLRCSVIVPTYNRAGLLRHTLESLAGQCLPGGRFEVIVVDDGSSDGTAEVVRGYAGQLDIAYHYQADEGYRVAKARNVGIAHARTDICVFVDCGVMLHSGCLAAHVDTHRHATGPVAVCGYVYCFNEDNEEAAEITAAVDPADPDATIAQFRDQRRWLDIREEFYAKYSDDFAGLPAPWVVFWTCNASAPTWLLREIGMFDEAYRSWGGEDLDLAYRLHQAGARFLLDRQAGGVHLPHDKSYAGNMRSLAGNYRYFAAKYGTPVAALLSSHHIFVINDIIREQRLTDGRQRVK